MDESMRYAHSDGHTDISFDDSGKYIITSGTDGDIRIWNGFDDDDPQSHHMGDNVSAVAFKNNVVYLSADNFAVSAYSFPEAEFDQILAQFNTAVHHIVCSKDGKLVAAGGGDFIIKVYDTSDKNLTAFRGHEGPILSLAFDPKGKYLASSGCDGTVRIWVLSTQECVKTLKMFKKSNDLCTTSTLCRIDWSSDGKYLAVPVEKGIQFYQRESWESNFTLTDDCILKDLSIVTYSPFGKYIAAAAVNGQMLVWDVETKQCLSKKAHEKEIAICGLKWNPSGHELAFCDIEGQLGIYSSPLNSNSDVQNIRPTVPVPDNSDMETFEDDNNMDIFDDDDDDNAFDIGAIKASLEPKIFGSDANEGEQSEKETIVKEEPKIQVFEAPKAPVQTAFQPSSTPVSYERRFMLWNDVGVVRNYNTDEENSIDVEFHDSYVYHPLHLNNTRNHTLAALSSKALLLSSPKLDGNTSKLECMHFGTWDSNKEWIVEMPEDEDIEAITLGEGYVACITDKMLVRIFSISGVQCEVFHLPGPVVSCAARNNQLLIVYHKGLGVDNNQCFNMMLVKVKIGGHCSTKECSVPLSSKAFLTWLGHTDEGSPCVVDTSGIISILSTSCGAKWTPIANSKLNLKGKSDNYFVIGLSEIKQEIRCILCKGSRYPALLPKPTIAVLPFSLPFCEMSTDKGRLEEENRRYAIAHQCMEALIKEEFDIDSEFTSVKKKWTDVLLKMFALATRTDREYRALDVAEMMPTPAIVEGAIRYATQRHHIALAERLGEVMNKKLVNVIESEDEDDAELFSEDMSESLISKTTLVSNLDSFSKDDKMLKPKPILKRKSKLEKSGESNEEGSDLDAGPSETNDSTPSSISLLPKSSPMANPFRAASKSHSKKEDLSNMSGIDEMLSSSMQSFASRNSSSNEQAVEAKKSRFPTKKDNPKKSSETENSEKGKNGFSLFFAENKEKIKASATPEASGKELIKVAMKMYKELPKVEKEKYLKECNGNNSPVPSSVKISNYYSLNEDDSEIKENTCEQKSSTPAESSMKRKESDTLNDDSTPKPKKNKSVHDKLPGSTVKKLTQFAFTKKPK